MATGTLVDTGAIVALLDEGDGAHQACRAALADVTLPLTTTIAVVSELFHFLGDNSVRLRGAWRFVRSRAVTVMPIDEQDLPNLERLMLKYADRPMDFADSTLVHLAEREGVVDILSIDSDFDVYRIGGRRLFRRFPKDR